MKYKEFGDETNPTILLLHGEWLSWWSFKDIIDFLKTDYHIVAPIIDGHGEDSETTFLSIQESAQRIIQYIDANLQGKVFAICGVSLGAQIVIEILSKRVGIAKYAVVESTLVVPNKRPFEIRTIAARLVLALIHQKWLAWLFSKKLCVSPETFLQYYQDSQNISYASWINIEKSRTHYVAPSTLSKSDTKVLIIIGSKEIKAMDKSVRLLMNGIPQSRVCIVPEMRHGELSLAHCTEYLALIQYCMT
ncbi:Alpha/beta fold family hydrolase [uncultured Eubacteriales bacterium]|uniref:Alpha/beta fold family hydrolase n=1 Tax=uncultured Eubacteriales bacterium TaxID=172733 RepID=A0A212J6C4_9FIRM|nr:Alpha/beta fold family hydrolase [uncultured Eubacteriales bacterium]